MRLALAIVLLPLVACSPSAQGRDPAVAATGGGASRIYQITDFTGVALRGSDDIDVRVGSGFSVRAEGPAAEIDKLRITRDGDMLRVDRKPSTGFDWGKHESVKVYVTMPRLTTAVLAGSGDLAVDRVEGERFRADVSGSGDLAIATLTVQAADLSLSGTGNVSAKGSAYQLGADLTGSGDIDAAGLKAASAKVSLAGSGNIRAEVDGPASVSVVGSGNVDLGARAQCTTTKTGSGEVHCAG